MCWVSALQYIFVRNYGHDVELSSACAGSLDDGKSTRVVLHAYPTCMQPVQINLGGSTIGKRGGLFNQIAVGTKSGKVLFYQIDGRDHKPLLQTKGGISFGAVTSLQVYPGGESILAGTETGELISFPLKEHVEQN